MDVQQTIGKARDAITVKRVYGDPYERDGVTVIPAAVVEARARTRAMGKSVVGPGSASAHGPSAPT